MSDSPAIQHIAAAVLALNPDQTAQAVQAALAQGVAPEEIVDGGIAGGMEAVGERYQRDQMFLPELLMAEQCMRSGLAALQAQAGAEGEAIASAARRQLAERAASWMPALSSCVNRLLHSSDSFLKA